MRIWKPLEGYQPRDPQQDLSCWFFEDVELPDLDYSDVEWQVIQGGLLADDDVYSKREIAHYYPNQDNPAFIAVREAIRKLIIEIRDNHPIKGLNLAWPIDTWSDDDLSGKHDLVIDFKRDNTGFVMGQHLDNRNTKWTLIINLRDNMDGTKIHIGEALGKKEHECGPEDIIECPTKKGSGLFFFNHREILHSIGPIREDGRLTAFYMKMIS